MICTPPVSSSQNEHISLDKNYVEEVKLQNLCLSITSSNCIVSIIFSILIPLCFIMQFRNRLDKLFF